MLLSQNGSSKFIRFLMFLAIILMCSKSVMPMRGRAEAWRQTRRRPVTPFVWMHALY